MHHTEWQGQAADPYDLNAYKKQFAEEHPLEGYLKDVEAGMPRFAGETGTKENPSTISNDQEFDGLPSGSYFKGPDGIVRRKQ